MNTKLSVSPTVPKRHILTTSLEDYFQVMTFSRYIQHDRWQRFDSRLEANTLKVLDLLDRYQLRSTFFVLGWIADRLPEIICEVKNRGHEVANKGYYPRSLRGTMPDELRDNLARGRDALERVTGQQVIGCRIPQQWFGQQDLWALDVIAEQGYVYDSSMVPLFRCFGSEPWRRFPHKHRCNDKILWEFPISTFRFGGLNLPISGGNYVRQFPHRIVKRLLEHWSRAYTDPFVMYFHVWEIDPDQVRIDAVSRLAKIRHYRRLEQMQYILEDYFRTYRFTGIAEYLGLQNIQQSAPEAAASRAALASPVVTVRAKPRRDRLPVTIVVPCFNEAGVLPYLSKTLTSVEELLEEDYKVTFLFVDDASTDNTLALLRQLFGSKPNCIIEHHPQNQGVAAAIMTGIKRASTEVVCSMDCDCTYDPHGFKEMITRLGPTTAMVTASPYHPQGHVLNLPGWRLQLSKIASLLYRCVLRQKLYTYTSCFRIYRRSEMVGVSIKNSGFIGVAEMLAQLDLNGGTIVEHPATLEVRLMGQSKMKTLRAATGHLKLLGSLILQRIQTRGKLGSRATTTGLAASTLIILLGKCRNYFL